MYALIAIFELKRLLYPSVGLNIIFITRLDIVEIRVIVRYEIRIKV